MSGLVSGAVPYAAYILPAAAGERGDREAYRKLQQDIIDDVLTPEQRAKVEKEQKERDAREGGKREGDAPQRSR